MGTQSEQNIQGPSSTRESVEFRSPAAASNRTIEIQIVAVPPNGQSMAYGHDELGNCVVLHGEREVMLELFRRLRQEGRAAEPAKVYFSADERSNVVSIERTACPTHVLPDIPEGSAVAWAPY